MNEGIFDPTQFAPATGAPEGGLPVSDANGHVVQIVDTELKQTKEGTGVYLQLKMQILDGPQKGAEGVDRLNLGNANPTTVEIACRQLSAYCAVAGVTQAFNYQQDANILCGKPFRAIVVLQNNDTGYTNVREVRFLDGRKANEAAPQAASMPAQMPQMQPQMQPQPQPQSFPVQPPNLGAQPGTPAFSQPQPAMTSPQPQPQPQPQPAAQPQMPWNQPPPTAG